MSDTKVVKPSDGNPVLFSDDRDEVEYFAIRLAIGDWSDRANRTPSDEDDSWGRQPKP